jgi:hypothetical protein
MTMRTAFLSCALVFSSGVAPGPRPARADEKPKIGSVTVDLSGRWVYNRELSDDAREKMREGQEGRGRPGGGPGGGGLGGPGRGGNVGRVAPPPAGIDEDEDDARESMRAILEPAEELAIVQRASEITIDERFGRMRRLHPDGKQYKTDNGASELKASWKEGKLLVETRQTRGGSVIETWDKILDGTRLVVNVKIEGSFGSGVTLKRTYDRAKESQPR